MSDKVRVTVSLDPELVDAIDAVGEEFSLSRSRIVRDVLGSHVREDGDASEAFIDAIPEVTRSLALKERADEKMRDKQKLVEKRASWRDRIKGHFRRRIEGDEAYHPDDMAELSEGYVRDAEIWIDDDDRVEEARDDVDEWLSYYRAGYWARQHADAVDTEICDDDVSGWLAVGEDVHTLRSRIDDVEEHIRAVADGSAFDSDAVIDAVASRYTVCEGAVRLLVELMIEDDSTVATAIASGGDRLGSAADAAGRLGASPEPEPEPITDGSGSDSESEDVVVIDGEEYPAEVVEDAIVGRGVDGEPDEVDKPTGSASRLDAE